MWIQIPDNIAAPPSANANFPIDNETLKLAKDIVKAEKLRRKEEAKKTKAKEEKAKPVRFTFLELVGAIGLCSTLVTMGQMYLFQMLQNSLTQLIQNAPH